MKWIEIIELRSATGNRDLLDNKFLGSLKDIKTEHGFNRIEFYRHCSLESDFRVHIHWESDTVEYGGSPLGQYLVQAFKELGLVNHSLWIEEIRK